jgi:hypothetical protein
MFQHTNEPLAECGLLQPPGHPYLPKLGYVLQTGVVLTKCQQLFCLLQKLRFYQLNSRLAYQKLQESTLDCPAQLNILMRMLINISKWCPQLLPSTACPQKR